MLSKTGVSSKVTDEVVLIDVAPRNIHMQSENDVLVLSKNAIASLHFSLKLDVLRESSRNLGDCL